MQLLRRFRMRKLETAFCAMIAMIILTCRPVAAADREEAQPVRIMQENAQDLCMEMGEKAADRALFEAFAEEAASLIEADEGLSADAQADEFQTKRLIVKSSQPLSDHTASACVSGYDDLFIFQYETVEAAKEAYHQFAQMECVLYVEPDEALSATENESGKEDTAVSERQDILSWGVSKMNLDKFQTFLLQNYNDEEAPDIVVAVVDTGLNSSASSVFDHRVLEGKRFASSLGMDFGGVEYADDNGHGTGVAGIIAEATPSNVKLLPIKVLDRKGVGTELVVYLGINYAISYGVDIINFSCGLEGDSFAYTEVMRKAEQMGIAVVAAAGNESQDVANISPACIDSVIAVSSIGENLFFSTFSNYGDKIDFAAPGGNIKIVDYQGGTKVESGTSFATPHITAAAALLLCARPELSSWDIFELLKENAVDAGAPGWDKYYGYGWIDMERLEDALAVYKLMQIADVDEDGTLTVLDALVILEAVSEERTLSLRQTKEADVDQDGEVTISDALMIMEHIVGRTEIPAFS